MIIVQYCSINLLEKKKNENNEYNNIYCICRINVRHRVMCMLMSCRTLFKRLLLVFVFNLIMIENNEPRVEC